ncbi:MAG: hypothetical protein ACXIUM_11650 [Wenzhouxiangella sp.]
MDKSRAETGSTPEHDATLIAWFIQLSPDQRLAELESRVAFLHSLRSSHDAELSRDSGSPQSASS